MSGIDKNTTQLYHFDTSLEDSITHIDAVPHLGSSAISNEARKFGTGGLSLSSGVLKIPTVDFGADDFTVDFWCKYVSGNDFLCMGKYVNDSDPLSVGIFITSDGYYALYTRKNGQTNSSRLVDSNYTHIAMVRTGSILMLFINGTKACTQDIGNYVFEPEPGGYDGIGGYAMVSSQSMTGYIDEFRISKGIARWTADFTPPISAYSWSKCIYIDEQNRVWGVK